MTSVSHATMNGQPEVDALSILDDALTELSDDLDLDEGWRELDAQWREIERLFDTAAATLDAAIAELDPVPMMTQADREDRLAELGIVPVDGPVRDPRRGPASRPKTVSPPVHGRPRHKPVRTIRWVYEPNGSLPAAVCITTDRQRDFYDLVEHPCGPTEDSRAFRLTKHDVNKNIAYDAVIAPGGCSCECLGFLRHDHCKHVEGLLALMGQENSVAVVG